MEYLARKRVVKAEVQYLVKLEGHIRKNGVAESNVTESTIAEFEASRQDSAPDNDVGIIVKYKVVMLHAREREKKRQERNTHTHTHTHTHNKKKKHRPKLQWPRSVTIG